MLPHRARAIAVAVAVFAAACAPSPSVDGAAIDDAPTTTRTPTTTVPVSPPTTPPSLPPGEGAPQVAPLDLYPIDPEELPPLTPVEGRIAYHGADASIRSGRSLISLDTGTLPGQPTWSRDGTRLAVVSLDGREPRIDVFDGASGEVIATAPAERLYFFLSWSHDGTRIAALGPGVDDNDNPRTVLDILDDEGEVLHADVAQAGSLFVAWEPDGLRLAAHADDRLLRVDADGTTTDLGAVGTEFFAPKWIPFSNEVLITTDVEGTPYIVRRSIDGADTLRTLGMADTELGISVNPDGHVAAIARKFDLEGAGAAERIDRPFLPQTTRARSGSVEILDLDSGERLEVFLGFTLWVEWNPQGTHLLIYEANVAAGTGTWWVYEHDVGEEPLPALEIVAFTPTPVFSRSYLVFADQFIETPRLWAPNGREFVYAEFTETGSLIRTADADAVATPATVGAGEVGFWSPSG